MCERYYYQYRGNGYGPFNTEEQSISDFRIRRMKGDNYKYGVAHLYKGNTIVNDNKRLTNGTELKFLGKIDLTWD